MKMRTFVLIAVDDRARRGGAAGPASLRRAKPAKPRQAPPSRPSPPRSRPAERRPASAPCSCRRPRTRSVALRIFFQVGAVDDPEGKEGLARSPPRCWARAAARRAPTPRCWTRFTRWPREIHVYGDKESIVFEGTVHRDNLAKFADLLADQVLTPRFADDDFTRNTQDALDYVTKTLRGNDDEDLGKQAMATILLYKGHPYGTPDAAGRWPASNAITLDDVRKLLRAHFTRDRLIVGVAGGYPDGFAEAFAKRFAALPAKAPPLPKLPPLPGPQGEPGPDRRREGRARARHLDRPRARRHPQGRRLLSADRRALVPGRAPHLQRRADEPPARATAASTTATTPTSRTSSRTAGRPSRCPTSRAASSTSRSGCARCRPRTACSRCAPRSTRPTS